MSFSAYPEYKDSGIDWLPEVPSHWKDKKIARDIPFVVGWTPPSGKDEYYDGDLPWVTIADMTQSSVEDTKAKISHLAVQDKGAKIVPAGSMLFSFKLSVGKVTFLDADSYTNEAIAGFPNTGQLDLEYWKYAAPEFIPRYGRENIYGATLLNQELIGSVRFFAPVQREQSQIAQFLDHETARIDALIEEQQRLIELLKEKRQAVISHAVTKGLDPTVPMKDSGVDWLGEVPAHWDIKKIKHFGRVIGGYAFKSTDFCDEGHLVIKISNVGHHGFEWSDSSYLPEAFAKQHSEFIAPKGALIFAMTRPIISGGIKVSRLESDSHPLVNQRVGFISINDEVSSRYLLESTQSESFLSQFQNNLTVTNQPNISSEGIESIQIAIPPNMEMKEILYYLERLSSSVECLVVDALHGIQLLQERRSALISAAVTGKIDVRGWQPPAKAASLELEKEAM